MPKVDTPGEPLSSGRIECLPRVLGLFDAVTVVVGSIIGSGIFLKIGDVAAPLHAFGPIIGVWIFVGLVTLCGSLALAELAAMLPHAGGPYVYLREAYGRPAAFLWGWTEFWVVRTGSVGALSCATVIYLARIVPMSHWTQGAIAIGIVLGLSVVNIISTLWGAKVQNVTSVVKVGFLAAIISLPVLLDQTGAANLEPIWPQSASGDLLKGLGLAMVAVMWPYDGWINIAPVAEEICNPQKNVPRGLAIGMLSVIVVYVGANISYHLTLHMDRLAGIIDPTTGEFVKNHEPSATIAFDVFEKLFGETGGTIAALGVMCSTFGAVNSNLLTGPRIYFAMARDGLLPESIRKVHSAYRTPCNAIIIQAVWTIVLLVVFYAWKDKPREAFGGLTDSVIFGGIIFYSLSVAAVYVLRRKHPDLPRPYRTWGYPLTPALLLIAYTAAAVSEFAARPTESIGVAALIATGMIYYAFASRTAAARANQPS
ncbi:MAG: APC family permease [Deltaproteobacteria bacterium]